MIAVSWTEVILQDNFQATHYILHIFKIFFAVLNRYFDGTRHPLNSYHAYPAVSCVAAENYITSQWQCHHMSPNKQLRVAYFTMKMALKQENLVAVKGQLLLHGDKQHTLGRYIGYPCNSVHSRTCSPFNRGAIPQSLPRDSAKRDIWKHLAAGRPSVDQKKCEPTKRYYTFKMWNFTDIQIVVLKR